MAKGQKTVLKSIGPLSVGKLYAVMMAVFGFFAGLVMALVGTLSPAGGLGMAAVIWVPLLYAILGFVGGIVGAWLYNLLAGWLGGIEMEFE